MSSSHPAENVFTPFSCHESLPCRPLTSPADWLWLRTFYEAQLTREGGDCDPVARAAALAGLLAVQRYQALYRVRSYVVALHAQLPGIMRDKNPAQIERLCDLMDLTMELLQDVWDPERTAFFEQLLPVQASLRKLAECAPGIN